MELPSQTDFMGRPTTPEQQQMQQMQQMQQEQQTPYIEDAPRIGTDFGFYTTEAPGLGQGVTENPGFSKEALEYFPPQRAYGGIMSLRR